MTPDIAAIVKELRQRATIRAREYGEESFYFVEWQAADVIEGKYKPDLKGKIGRVNMNTTKPEPKHIIIPSEPTQEMLNAYDEARAATTMTAGGIETYNPHQSYWALLNAAPKVINSDMDIFPKAEVNAAVILAQSGRRFNHLDHCMFLASKPCNCGASSANQVLDRLAGPTSTTFTE